MNKNHDAASDDGKGKQTTGKRSVFLLFILGGLMVTLPLILMLNWSSSTCSVTVHNFCRGSQLYRTSASVLPYVMLAGGAVVGYNMKRVYDLANPRGEGDGDQIEDKDGDFRKFPSYDDMK